MLRKHIYKSSLNYCSLNIVLHVVFIAVLPSKESYQQFTVYCLYLASFDDGGNVLYCQASKCRFSLPLGFCEPEILVRIG